MKKQTTFRPSEMYNVMKNLIESNDKIYEKGGLPVALSISGSHGIGKSTLCKEVAQDLGRPFYKLNLAQLTEPSELIGFYQKESEMTKTIDIEGVKSVEQVWVPESLLPKFFDDGFEYTGKTRTIPCPPEWVQNIEDGTILCLDDFSRGNSLLAQAVMELINELQMIGWNLTRKKVQIILNENPDDGTYNTSSLDCAQVDRMFKATMVWSASDWAVRAEKIGLDERLINFVLWMPEFFENKKEGGISADGNVSPRMLDKFFSVISTIDDFTNNMNLITQLASISVGDTVGAHLVKFINNKLDKLPSVQQLIMEFDLKEAKTALTKACGSIETDGDNAWNPATSAILAIRSANYVIHNAKTMTKDQVKKYADLIHHTSFSEGQKLIMVKQCVKLGNTFSQTLAGDPRFSKILTVK